MKDAFRALSVLKASFMASPMLATRLSRHESGLAEG
jgi:hypothetical protein